MSQAIATSIAAAIGTDHVRTDVGGRIIATPPSIESLAHLLGLAYDGSWSVTVAGNGTWQVNDAPTALTISMRALDQMVEYDREPVGQMTVQGGLSLEGIQRHTASRPRFPHKLRFDAPGRLDRTIGSVVATGGIGPLRVAGRPLLNELSGLVVVTGDGRIVTIDGDEAELENTVERMRPHVGGFGAFGVVAQVRLITREVPTFDRTWLAVGDGDTLVMVARGAEERHVPTSSIELLSPALAAQPDWALAVRVLSPDDIWEPVVNTVFEGFSGLTVTALSSPDSSALWSGVARAMTSGHVTLRLGATLIGMEETLDLVLQTLGEGVISSSLEQGTLRWSGDADTETLRSLRMALAAREIPLTIERAPWQIRNALGHLGTFHEGLGGVVSRLKESFDPRGVLSPAALAPESRH